MNRPTVRQRSLGACMNPAAQAAVLKNPRVDESNGLADQPRTLFGSVLKVLQKAAGHGKPLG